MFGEDMCVNDAGVNRLLSCAGVQLKKVVRLSHENELFHKDIYLNSFPPEERRDWDCLMAFAGDAGHPLSFYEILWRGERAGFITAWSLPFEWTYIEHFAVSEKVRGNGIGRCAVEMLCGFNDKVVLEVELPECGETAQRRIAFYERCGFAPQTAFEYVQPSYGAGLPEVPMMLMTYGGGADSLEEVAGLIKRNVYGKV